jgi:FkbM family methyltransferase
MSDTDLPTEVGRLHRMVMEERSIDLVEDGPYLILHYTDEWYASVPLECRNRTEYDLAGHQKPCAPIVDDVDRFFHSLDIAADPWGFMLAYYSRIFREFTVCDIGSHYGQTTMDTALALRSLRANAKLLSFEPGICGTLTPLNYENNGFREIYFYRAAVGPVDGHVVLYREIGQSENNRIVKLTSQHWGAQSFPVRCIRIDTLFREIGAFGPTLAKIDTQGGEPGVIAGMIELMREHPVSMLMEYTPGAIFKTVNPVDFIRRLLQSHWCFDTGVEVARLVEVTPDTAEQHRRSVSASEKQWVDLLLLAKTAPGAEDAYARLKAAALMPVAAQARFGSAADSSGSPPRRPRLDGERLSALISAGRSAEAAGLLEDVDLDGEFGADFQYLAGVCLENTGQPQRAIILLKRAAAGGFLPCWCAYMLGACESKLRDPLNAAYFYTVGVVL